MGPEVLKSLACKLKK